MRAYAPRLAVRQGRVTHDGAVLSAIGCVAAAALLYLMVALLLGSDDDGETLGAIDRDDGTVIVERGV